MSNTLTRILDQYKQSPKILGLLEALSGVPGDDAISAAQSLMGRLDIDNSEGIQLDRIGYIVGLERPLLLLIKGAELPDRFTMLSELGVNDPDKGFSQVGPEPKSGGFFVGLDKYTKIPDTQYRKFLKAIVFFNNSGRTVFDIEKFLFISLSDFVVIVSAVGYIDVEILKEIDQVEIDFIKKNLRAGAGIKIRNIKYTKKTGA